MKLTQIQITKVNHEAERVLKEGKSFQYLDEPLGNLWLFRKLRSVLKPFCNRRMNILLAVEVWNKLAPSRCLPIIRTDEIVNSNLISKELEEKLEAYLKEPKATIGVTKVNNSKYNDKAIQRVTLVFGKDSSDMTEGDFLSAISKLKEEIKNLRDLDVESLHIKKRVETLEGDLSNICKLMDQLFLEKKS